MARPTTLAPRALRVLRRALLTLLGVQVALAVGLTLVDSYRRRGGRNRPRPFPVTPPSTVPVGDGELTTYTFGQDLYDAMLAAVEGARHRIWLETYIWKGDEVGERFKRALVEAAERGVDVRVVYDAFANLVVSPRFLRFPPPVKVLRYPVHPAGWRLLDVRRYGREHRKILVVDGEVGFVGGYNLGTAYATEWRDTHVRVTGPAAADLERAFADFWNLVRGRRRARREGLLEASAPAGWDPCIRVHRNVPRQLVFPIRAVYLEAIQRASRNVWLTQAYFLPDQDFVDAVKDAAERGVDVRLLVPLKSNHVVADWVSRGYYSQLLEAGVRILRYRDAMVHAKTATVDGRWSTVGTANIDRLSLQGNYEVNLEVLDPGFAEQLERVFRTDQENCLELRRDEWEARDFHRRFTERVLAPLRPLL